MNAGQTVFSQLMDHLPSYEFQKCVERYRGDAHHRGFSCRDPYLAIAFAQLTYRESLRDIEACLGATKENVLLERRYSHPVDKSTGVHSDQTVVLATIGSASAYPDTLRRVSYFDAVTGKRLVFLTNNFTLPALIIAQIYKQRWQVELFFENTTWCTPPYVIESQRASSLNSPLVGVLPGFLSPCSARHPFSAVSMGRSHRFV
jgi:hypothetical protein